MSFPSPFPLGKATWVVILINKHVALNPQVLKTLMNLAPISLDTSHQCSRFCLSQSCMLDTTHLHLTDFSVNSLCVRQTGNWKPVDSWIFLLESWEFHFTTKRVHVIWFCPIIQSHLDGTLRRKCISTSLRAPHAHFCKGERGHTWKGKPAFSYSHAVT